MEDGERRELQREKEKEGEIMRRKDTRRGTKKDPKRNLGEGKELGQG